MHRKLMIPGPIEVEDEVLTALGAPVLAHYGEEWVPYYHETMNLLRQLFATSGKVFMLPGSGSLGADAAVGSTFAPGEKVLLGINGFFGTRWREILEANGVIPIIIETPLDQALNPAQFARILADDPSISGVIAVHLETSTAVLNPIRELASIAHTHDALFMVDAISSLAGTPLPMDAWEIDVCVSAPQKGIGGVAGLAFVAANDRAWEKISSLPEKPRSWFLDLRRWQRAAEGPANWHPYPVTMPSSTIMGLRAALQSLINDGLQARIDNYKRMAKHLRTELQTLGFSLFVPAHMMSPVLTTAYCPDGINAPEMVKYIAEKHHIQISLGFGTYRERMIRIGHMGGALDDGDIDALLAGIRQFLVEHQAISTK
jgi:alanine-glyoxylate transaminase/serine-glyoxylate transaminase/serine-pyruvate transaminase